MNHGKSTQLTARMINAMKKTINNNNNIPVPFNHACVLTMFNCSPDMSFASLIPGVARHELAQSLFALCYYSIYNQSAKDSSARRERQCCSEILKMLYYMLYQTYINTFSFFAF